MNFTNGSINFLEDILEIEGPIKTGLNNLFSPDWLLILASSVIAAYVAIKIDRHFQNRKRIYQDQLIKIAAKETIIAFLIVFISIIIYGSLLLAFLNILRYGKENNPLITICLLILIGILYYYIRKWRKRKRYDRFKKKEISSIE